MRCVAYVTATNSTDGGDVVAVRPLSTIQVQVTGFHEVLTPASEETMVAAEWFEGHALPGYFDLDLVDDAADDVVRLDPDQVTFKSHAANGLRVLGTDVMFTDSQLPEGGLPGSWRDRLLAKAPTLRLLAGVSSDGRRLLIWSGTPLYQEWVDDCLRRDSEAAERYLNRQIKHGAAFVNPYTFVPLPSRVVRSKPAGHERASEGSLTGYIDATFHLETPMMLDNDFRPETEGTTQQVIRVPGSSIRGAVRSLYEVMTDSCLSVIDPDYLPVHRSPLSMDPKARLAVVTQCGRDGSPIHVCPTSRVIWIPALWLHPLFPDHPEQLRSGQLITLDETQVFRRDFGRGVQRDELSEQGKASIRLASGNPRAGEWVVHVADAGTKGGHPAERIYVAAGKLEQDDIPLAPGAWDDYRQRCLGSQDVERGTLANHAPAWVETDWPGVTVMHEHKEREHNRPQVVHCQVIGTRRKSDGALAIGDSIWITPATKDGTRVATALKMSASWRVWGARRLRDRLPDKSLLPCHDPEDLCPACALFGFVEQRTGSMAATGDATRVQNAYASHVRFSAVFTTTEPVGIQQIHPPPMRSPRPSAGNFYFAYPEAQPPLRESGTAQMGRAASHWGASDNPLRMITGRKFYWHGQEDWDTIPTPRQKRRDHYPQLGDPGNKDAPRWLMDKGSELSGRVYFEDITRDQLAFLLMAVDPTRLSTIDGAPTATGTLQTHLGGGKPLGFGSATVTVTVFAEDAAGRYLETAAHPDPDELLTLKAPVAPDATWLPGLVKALSSLAVPANRIWYPTMGNFDRRATNAQRKEFDESHRFYAAFSGGTKPKGHESVARMRTLPRVSEANQLMSNEETEER